MSIKDKAISTCTTVWGQASQATTKIYTFLSQKSVELYRSEQLHNGLVKAKEFYHENKELCLIGATVATIWIVAKVSRQKDQSTLHQNPEDPKI